MTKVFRSTKKRVIHPLSCWDIITYQFSTLPNRWDLKILEEKKRENGWTVDLNAMLKKAYHSFIVIDTADRICWKSKKFDELLPFRSYAASRTHKPNSVARIKEIFDDKQFPTKPTSLSSNDVIPHYNIKFFPLQTTSFKLTHFFILMIAKK